MAQPIFKYIMRINQIDMDIKEAEETKERIHANIVRDHSPVKIGDLKSVNYYSNIGKTIRIDKIEFYGMKDDPTHYVPIFMCEGYIILKDGSNGKQRGEWISEKL